MQGIKSIVAIHQRGREEVRRVRKENM